jgi:hypothetical protein
MSSREFLNKVDRQKRVLYFEEQVSTRASKKKTEKARIPSSRRVESLVRRRERFRVQRCPRD